MAEIKKARVATTAARSAEAHWKPVSSYDLYQNLLKGTDFYLGQVENALYREAYEKVDGLLQSWFGDIVVHAHDKTLRKIINSAMALGTRAVERTVDAVRDLPYWSDHLEPLSFGEYKTFVIADASKFYGDDKRRCDVCEKIIKERDGNIMQGIDEDFHLACWCALEIRNALNPLRSSKVALDKQARSARSILSVSKKTFATPTSYASRDPITSPNIYEAWKSNLFAKWAAETDVKETFHSTYWANFDEYCDIILKYVVQEKVPTRDIQMRLVKHISDDEAKKVISRLKTMPVKMLRYFGLVDDEQKEQKSLPEYLSKEKKNKEADDAPTWMDEALCAQTDPEVFMTPGIDAQKEAIKVCLRCSVRAECLSYALENGETRGIWGGKTPEERSQLAGRYEEYLDDYLYKQRQEASKQDAIPAGASSIYKMDFKNYNDCRKIGEKYRDGATLLLNMTSADSEEDRKRAIDFISGMVFAQSGSIQRVSPGIFLILRPDAEIKGDVATPGKNDDPYEFIRKQLLA